MSFARKEHWKIPKNEFKYGVVISQKEKILPLKFFLNTDTLYSLCLCLQIPWHHTMQIISSNYANVYLSFKESWIRLEFKAARWVCYTLFLKAPCKRTQYCWPITPNIVGCYMLRPFAHPVACFWVLLRVVGSCRIRLHTTANKDATTPNIALLAQNGGSCCVRLHVAYEQRFYRQHFCMSV